MTIWLKIIEKKFFSNRSQNKNVSILSFEIFAEPGKQKAVKLTPYLPTAAAILGLNESIFAVKRLARRNSKIGIRC